MLPARGQATSKEERRERRTITMPDPITPTLPTTSVSGRCSVKRICSPPFPRPLAVELIHQLELHNCWIDIFGECWIITLPAGTFRTQHALRIHHSYSLITLPDGYQLHEVLTRDRTSYLSFPMHELPETFIQQHQTRIRERKKSS